MSYTQAETEDVWIIGPRVFNDAHGYLMEVFREGEFRASIGDVHFVQDDGSKSSFGVLCGLYYQKGEYSQARLVRVIKDKVLDVAVDLRQSFPTFGKYVSVELGERNGRQFLIPRGFAHSFLVSSEEAIFIYKVDNGYTPQAEASTRFNGETVDIDWPTAELQLLLSEKGGHTVPPKDAGYFEQDIEVVIVGTGYVGLVTDTCFTEIDVNVICADTNSEKIETLNQGIIPIYKNELEDMVHRDTKAERLQFTISLKSCLGEVDVTFSAVETSPNEDDSTDLSYVFEVACTIGRSMKEYVLMVTRSTVPVGTTKKVCIAIQEKLDKRGVQIEFGIVSGPEFLKKEDTVADFVSPDQVVVDVESERVKELMSKLYKPFLLDSFRVTFIDIPSAEMAKYTANSMLVTRISFMDDMANLCELTEADVNMARNDIGPNIRIDRRFFYPKIGYGGPCFPKDVKTLTRTVEQNGYQMRVLQVVEEINE